MIQETPIFKSTSTPAPLHPYNKILFYDLDLQMQLYDSLFLPLPLYLNFFSKSVPPL